MIGTENQVLRVKLDFDMDFVLSQRGEAQLPVENFLQHLQGAHSSVKVESSGLTDCVFTVEGDLAAINWEVEVTRILDDLKVGKELVKVTVAAENETPEPKKESEAAEKAEESGFNLQSIMQKGKSKEDQRPAKESIDELIGAHALKSITEEMSLVAPYIIRTGTQDAFAAQTYLFAIGDGCGLSTAIRLMAQHIQEMELFSFRDRPYAVEYTGNRTPDDMLQWADSFSAGRFMCFDISGWLDKIGSREFRVFLQRLSVMRAGNIFAFRIPFVDEATQKHVQQTISDVFFVKEVPVPPLSMAELRQYAESLLTRHQLSMDEGAWKLFEDKIIHEKSDGCFYDLQTVKKVVDEIIYQKHRYDAIHQVENDSVLIRGEEIQELIPEAETGDAMERLDKLIGIGPIKERIMSVLDQIELAKTTDGVQNPSLHMRFVGGPGTGKTTVARIMGQLAKDRGILSKGLFFEYAGRDFCGQYVGETAPKTAAMCRDAYGSVLFIDEAYALYRGNRDSNDFGREAIDTLIAQMENHRDDFLVIMAGYEEDMDILMHANVGLASRMPHTIHFPNYNRDELFEIFMSMTKESFAYEEGFETKAREYFDGLSQEVLDSPEFANARFVRNLFERTWGKAATRRQMEPDAPFVLTAVDFDKAVAEREFADLQKRKVKQIGFASV